MDEDKITLAKVETQLESLTAMVKELKDSLSSSVVSRNEWELRNHYVDTALKNLQDDVGELKTNRGPWWVWVTAVIGIVTLIWSLAQPLVTSVLAQ